MGWVRSGKHMFGISRRGITDTCVRFVGVLALKALQGADVNKRSAWYTYK